MRESTPTPWHIGAPRLMEGTGQGPMQIAAPTGERKVDREPFPSPTICHLDLVSDPTLKLF